MGKGATHYPPFHGKRESGKRGSMGTEAAQAAPGAEKRPRATTPRRETWRTWIDGRSSRAGPAWRRAPRFWAPPAAPRRLRQPTTRSPARRLASCRPTSRRATSSSASWNASPLRNLPPRKPTTSSWWGPAVPACPPCSPPWRRARRWPASRRRPRSRPTATAGSFVVKAHSNPAGHRAVAQRLGPPQRLAHQQRAVQLLCGICRGGRALGYQPGTLGRHRAHRVPHRQLHPLRRWRRRRRVRCHPGLEPGSYGGPGPEGGRGRRHVLLRDPLRAAGPGGGRHRNGRPRQAKGRQLRQGQRHQGVVLGRPATT